MGILPSPPACPVCDDLYEPNDSDDPPQGYCSWACWEVDVIG